jgi:cytochrome c biogenesis protein CcmG/thiol:disulfide interchange protein DsbE
MANLQGPKPPSPKKSSILAMVLVGAGFVMLGLMAGWLLLAPDRVSDAARIIAGSDENNSAIPAEVSFPAPKLSLTGLDGSRHTLDDYKGQVVLVNNWATWCPPCKAEMPTLEEYFEDHKEQGFILIAIEAGESEDEVNEFADKNNLTFQVWLDPRSLALDIFQNWSLPSSYIIDREGIVRLAWTGAVSRAMLDRYITPMLEE